MRFFKFPTSWPLLFLVFLKDILIDAGRPLNVQVTLRGKKYSVPSVSSVRELQINVQGQSGVSPENQGRVLFGGKKLKSSDVLEDVGVEDGSVINVVPGKKKSNSSAMKVESGDNNNKSAASPSAEGNLMEDMLRQAGVDKSQLDDLMKAMPGGADGMPDMEESMKMMQEMMNSPIFQEYMNDPEKLEQSRQMILNNPMMKGMMAGMPCFSEILEDPIKWRETMVAAANMYKDMGPNLLNALGGGGAMPPGAFGLGNGNGAFGTGSASALDELSEGEE
mmetsp:Transcript_3668/g.5043  ORF Transcript_3668/g.5043 Transcript_3668/m.5043 type:complete len:278 (+) Transcript_3668:112-945(+)|eukprot:CAMPEP_0184871886 /NCGR_PEP_ID=MMETSP0580-20130426/40975_1 /TAXON_ID=1118495 /ORGANISM="Dactyliosolen fragilissimus" /LENGTH=277 /DNA_ID=CAMNT_0027374605 /DNA_START=540 /DNA_END=1373 /DNA_ORIENTATION=-